jgi:hypothetical protein
VADEVPADLNVDEDGAQEYLLAILEGCDDDEARYRAGRANNSASSARQLRTRSLLWSWVDERSLQPRPLPTSDMISPEKQERALALLDLTTPQQRRVLEARLGFATGHTLTHAQTAEVLGLSRPQRSFDLEQRGLARIRRELSKPPMEEAAKKRLERKRELNRQWMARRRAELKGAA